MSNDYNVAAVNGPGGIVLSSTSMIVDYGTVREEVEFDPLAFVQKLLTRGEASTTNVVARVQTNTNGHHFVAITVRDRPEMIVHYDPFVDALEEQID